MTTPSERLFELIREREESFIRRAIASWSCDPKISILGNVAARSLPPVPDDPRLSPDFEHLRWFPLPGEVHAELAGHDQPHVHGSIHPR